MQPPIHRNLTRLLVALHLTALAIVTFVGLRWPVMPTKLALAGLGLSQVSLIGLWAVLGGTAVPLRVVASVLAVGVVAGSWNLLQNPGTVDVRMAMLYVMPMATLCGATALLRQMGVQVVRVSPERPIESGTLQFSLRGFFLAPTVVAVCLVAIRRLEFLYPTDELATICVICMVATLLALWLCLGQSKRYWRLLAIPLTVAAILPAYYFEGWLVVLVMGMAALISMATLTTVRCLGYRVRVAPREERRAEFAVAATPVPANSVLL
ncbi:MAG: hypothetical protein ABUL64_01390 [Singulisphaera sp.]